MSKIKLKELDSLQCLFENEGPQVVCHINLEVLKLIFKDRKLATVVNSFDYNLVDGQVAKRYLGLFLTKKLKKHSGSSLYADILSHMDTGQRVLLIGGDDMSHNEALKRLRLNYPGLMFYGDNRDFSKDDASQELAELINMENIRYVMVCLGAPKQEFLISDLTKKVSGKVLFQCAGGTVDFISGKYTRPAVWIQSIGCEWLFRAIENPTRWKREISTILFFARNFFKVHKKFDARP